MRISDELKPAAVQTNLSGSSVEEIISELSELVADDSANLDSNHLRESLLRRERLLSTAMGAGIAFPHCTSDRISAPRFALGISRSGVEADAPDNKPVNIFFVVISPESDPNVHLDALAAAARIFINPASRESVLAAKSAEEAISVLAEAEGS